MKVQKFLTLTAAVVVLTLSAGAQASWVTIADWQFNGDTTQWLEDSANGYDLTNVGASQGGGGTTAVFGGYVWTDGNTIDLTSYDQVRVSWRMKASAGYSVIWEHGTGTANPGDLATLAGNAGERAACLNETNIDQLPHSIDTWQTFVVEYDLQAATAADVVRVWVDGVEQADSTQYGIHGMPGAGYTFLDNDMNIGARNGGSYSFAGEIDYLTIEVVPEPATMVLLGVGGIGLLIRRKRK